MILIMPLSQWLVIHMLGLATNNSTTNHYEDRKGDAKYIKLGVLE